MGSDHWIDCLRVALQSAPYRPCTDNPAPALLDVSAFVKSFAVKQINSAIARDVVAVQ